MGEAKRRFEAARTILQSEDRTLIFHNSDGTEEVWEGDHATYNVTRARTLAVGPFLEDLSKVYAKNAHLEVDLAYADRLSFERINEPLLLIEQDDGKVYLIDGRHRLEARHRRGMTTCLVMIVPKEARPRIEVTISIFEKGTRVLHTRFMKEAMDWMVAQRAETKGETNG